MYNYDNYDNYDKLVSKTEELCLSLHQVLFNCNSGGEISSDPSMKFFQHSPHPTQMGIHLLKGQLAAKTILCGLCLFRRHYYGKHSSCAETFKQSSRQC